MLLVLLFALTNSRSMRFFVVVTSLNARSLLPTVYSEDRRGKGAGGKGVIEVDKQGGEGAMCSHCLITGWEVC